MRRLLLSRGLGSIVLACLVFGACSTESPSGLAAPPASAPARSTLGPLQEAAAPATTTGPADDHGEHEDAEGLTPARRVELGLSAPPGTIPGLTAQQWLNAEAVASRFVLADTTYTAAEDPGAVNARRATYATARLGEELSTSSSGGARLEELRRRQARFAGEVLTIATRQDTSQLAVVEIGAAVTTTGVDPPERRVRFYRLTLSRESPTERWLVARVEQS